MALAPVRDEAELENASHAMFHWRASDLTIDSVNGLLGTRTRGATISVDDLSPTSFTMGYVTPAFEPRAWGSYNAMTLKMGSADHLDWACDFRPRAMAFFIEFLQVGAMASAGTYLWSITNSGATVAKLGVYSDGTVYNLVHNNAVGGSVAVGLAAAPATLDRVRMWGYLNANGSVQLSQSINEATAINTSTTAANAMASTWGGGTARIRLSGHGTTAGVTCRHRSFKLVAGVPSVATLQRYF